MKPTPRTQGARCSVFSKGFGFSKRKPQTLSPQAGCTLLLAMMQEKCSVAGRLYRLLISALEASYSQVIWFGIRV